MIDLQHVSMDYRKDRLVIVSIILSVFLFLIFSGTITSGFHFVDDHEVIKIKADLKSSTFLSVTKSWVLQDFKSNGRFRPLYYINRVLETKLLGSDFTHWSLSNGVLCCLAFISFYAGARNLKFSIGESIVFLIVTFIGPQSSIWWRLGPSESLGMVLLGLSFYFMSKSREKRNYLLNSLLFIIFLILSSLTKESFLIIIPAMVFFKIWNEKNCIWASLKESIRKNFLLILPLLVVFSELIFIKYYVGTEYSGLDSNFLNSLTSIMNSGLHFIKTYHYLLITCLLILVISFAIKRRILVFNLISSVFFLLIIGPNLILYAKSGLVERYLLPTSFGLALLLADYIKNIKGNPLWFRKIAVAIIIVSFLPFVKNCLTEAISFSLEGRETKILLSGVVSTNISGSQTMVVVDPVQSYEASVSLKTYLFSEGKIDLYGYWISKDESSAETQSYIEGWKSYFTDKQFENMTSKPGLLIFLDNKIVDDFFIKSKLSRIDYLPVDIGNSRYALMKEIR